jgi:hypothetical protein
VVRAYAWRMTVERLLRILISAIRKQGFFKGLFAHQLPMRAPARGGELVLVGGQQPIGTDLGRSATNSRSSGGGSPSTGAAATVAHLMSCTSRS